MKESTGELSMTVITIVAVLGLLAIIGAVTPMVKDWIDDTFNDMTNTDVSVVENDNLYYNL